MYTPNRTSSKVTFVENLPDMDELIENYEQSSNQPMQPPPKRSGAYTLYENIYGGGMESKSMGMRTKFEDESANKDILLNKALQKLPTRFTSEINGSGSESHNHNHREVEEQPKMFVQEHHHNRPYVIYENNHLPSYTLPPPLQQPSHFSSYQQHNYPPPPPPTTSRTRPRPPPKRRPPVKQQQKEIHSLCSMINSHISSCSLCNNLYISTLKSKCKPQKRNMSTVAFVIVILILITVCFLLMRRVWKLSPTSES